jgi:hypothetical protein
MKHLTIVVAALALSSCAAIPRGPALTYEQLLPNTHENPVWARNVHAGPALHDPAPAGGGAPR